MGCWLAPSNIGVAMDFFGELLPTWKVLASADILADLRSEASHVDGQSLYLHHWILVKT